MRSTVIACLAFGFLVACNPADVDPVEPVEPVEPVPEPRGLPEPGELQDTPDASHVILENDFVRVVEFIVPPGARLPTHRGFAQAVYALSDFQLRFVGSEGVVERSYARGEGHWHPVEDHSFENVGVSDAHFVAVMRTAAPLPPDLGHEADEGADAVTDLHAVTVYADDPVRIIEVRLPPGANLPEHDGVARVVYSKSEYTLEYRSDRFEDRQFTRRPGDANWYDPDQHEVENIGTTFAEFVVFKLKE